MEQVPSGILWASPHHTCYIYYPNEEIESFANKLIAEVAQAEEEDTRWEWWTSEISQQPFIVVWRPTLYQFYIEYPWFTNACILGYDMQTMIAAGKEVTRYCAFYNDYATEIAIDCPNQAKYVQDMRMMKSQIDREWRKKKTERFWDRQKKLAYIWEMYHLPCPFCDSLLSIDDEGRCVFAVEKRLGTNRHKFWLNSLCNMSKVWNPYISFQ